ncbi:MAG: hypothetical protein KDK08_19955 [Rhizobiaceae bacterium]|nr:hypothetical protein [Rhizobiaceae bacterium]
MRKFLFSFAAMTLLASPAGADPSQEDIDAARAECRDAFLARDAEAYMNAAASMIAWGSLQNPEWTREVELCLAFADAIENANLDTARERAAEMSNGSGLTSAPSSEYPAPLAEAPAADTRLADYIAKLEADGADVEVIVREIATDTTFAPPPSPERDALEAALTAHVRPIPAAQAERNLIAYQALSRVDTANQTYKDRVARYELAIEAERVQLQRTARQLEGRLVRKTAEFDGSSWARHPSSPRYQDIRNYVTLYLIETGTGQQTMELFFNYTSRSGWLFVGSASINIDGQTTRIPVGEWLRDNDTEIWEFASLRGDAAVTLARSIADADRAVIRFNGQQFYDDYVVSDGDKRVIREMLAMWDVISAE